MIFGDSQLGSCALVQIGPTSVTHPSLIRGSLAADCKSVGLRVDTGQCRRWATAIAFARHVLRCPKDEENQHDQQIDAGRSEKERRWTSHRAHAAPVPLLERP